MDVTTVALDQEKARELYQAYKAHQQYGEEIDREIQRTYRLIAQGRVVIRALESVKQAGLDDQGYPKLAIGRADQPHVCCKLDSNGSAVMASEHQSRRWLNTRPTSTRLEWPAGSFPDAKCTRWIKALTPVIPIHLRPKQALREYHVLWEAEWEPIPPRDPYLLRRIGKGDLWLVCAAWDLTEVERAAMAARVSVS